MFEFLDRFSRGIARHRQQSASARALTAFNDRQLKDISLNRSQIPAEVGKILCVDPFRSF